MTSQPSDRLPEPESPDQLPRPIASAPGAAPPPKPKKPRLDPYTAHNYRVTRRRDRIVAEIERNRRGEAAIPTWVLAVILLVIVVGFTALVIFG